MNMKRTTTWIGALATVLMLAFTSCSYNEFPALDQEGAELLTAQGDELSKTDLLVVPISGHGFKMEIRQDPSTPDEVEMFFYSGDDLLSSVGYDILIEAQQELDLNATVEMTVKDFMRGDLTEFPTVEKNFRGNSLITLDLSPDKYDLNPAYGLKFTLKIHNNGTVLEPGNLIYRMTGGHIMAENVDGRQLYASPMNHGILGRSGNQGNGGQGNNIVTDNGEVGNDGNQEDYNENSTSVINGDDQAVEAPIQHGGHISVENVDGRQTHLRPLRPKK